MKKIATQNEINEVVLEVRLLSKQNRKKCFAINNKQNYNFFKNKIGKNQIEIILPRINEKEFDLYLRENKFSNLNGNTLDRQTNLNMNENFLRHQLSVFKDKKIFQRIQKIIFQPFYIENKGNEISELYSPCAKTLVLFLNGIKPEFSNYRRSKVQEVTSNGKQYQRLQAIYNNILRIFIPKKCHGCKQDSCKSPVSNYFFQFHTKVDSQREEFLKCVSHYFENRVF